MAYLFFTRSLIHLFVSFGFFGLNIRRFASVQSNRQSEKSLSEDDVELIENNEKSSESEGSVHTLLVATSPSKPSNLNKFLYVGTWITVITVMFCFGSLSFIFAWISELERTSIFFYGHSYIDVGGHSLAYGFTFHFLFVLCGYGLISLVQKIGIPLGIFSTGIISSFVVFLAEVVVIFQPNNSWNTYFSTHLSSESETDYLKFNSLWIYLKVTLILALISFPLNCIANFLFIKKVPLSSPTTSVI